MASVQPLLKIELNPNQPIPEICAVIAAVIPYHAGREEALLLGLKDAIEQRLKGVEQENGTE